MSLLERSELLDTMAIESPSFASIHNYGTNTLIVNFSLGFSC